MRSCTGDQLHDRQTSRGPSFLQPDLESRSDHRLTGSKPKNWVMSE